jgi:hypothetical protein
MVYGHLNKMAQSYKLGQAPWEVENEAPSFKLGEAPWEQNQVEQTIPEKKSGLQSFIQSVAEPFLKLPTTVAAAGARVVGGLIGGAEGAEKARQSALEGLDYGYFGNVKPIGADAFKKYQEGEIGGGEFATRAVGDLAGTAAEIGSYAVGGGGAAQTIKTGLKGLIKEGAKEGLKTGALSGGLFSFGDTLQDAEAKPMDIAYNTLFGTTLGGVTGGVLGGATPLATKAVRETGKLFKVPELQIKLADSYKKIFNPTAPQLKKDARFGNDSFKFLAEEMPDLPIEVDKNGKIVADDGIEMMKQKYSAEATAYKSIIRNSGKYVDIDKAIANAKAAAKNEFDGSDLAKAQKQIEEEIEAYIRTNPQDINVTPSGNRFMTIARADDVKSYSWARGKGWGNPDAEVWNDTNNIIGHTIKDAIENELTEAPVKAMNKRLGQWKNAIDLVEKRNGQVSGTGGKLAKYLARSVGTAAGASLGGDGGLGAGVAGAYGGFMTASALAALLANPKVRLFAIRQLLNKLEKAGRKDLIQEAEQILQEQASKYLLPAAGKSSYIEKPIVLPKSIRETNLGLDEVKNLGNKSPQVRPNQSFGAVAGFEFKKDENGKTKFTFNPEKATVGILGTTAYSKLPVKIKQDVLDTVNILKNLKSNDFMKNGRLNIDILDVVENFFEKAKKGTINADDIRAAKEAHFMLKGRKEI